MIIKMKRKMPKKRTVFCGAVAGTTMIGTVMSPIAKATTPSAATTTTTAFAL